MEGRAREYESTGKSTRTLEHKHGHENEHEHEHEHEHENERSSTITSTRVREHEYESTGTRALINTRARARRRRATPVGRVFNNECGFACPWMALRVRNASPWMFASFCDLEAAGHVSRISARAHTCSVAYGRASCVPRRR